MHLVYQSTITTHNYFLMGSNDSHYMGGACVIAGTHYLIVILVWMTDMSIQRHLTYSHFNCRYQQKLHVCQFNRVD